MSKILSNVLNKVSENNNQYRVELQKLNKYIDEKTTALVGEIVTLSNYTLDFSNAVISAKEIIVDPISRSVESYAIKDLRSVEAVNEQFIDKINDKIDNTSINSADDKNNFIENLNDLLNDKYLEIVKIKRVDFISNDGTNGDVENAVLEFNNYLTNLISVSKAALDEKLALYKKDIYELISNTLNSVSKLYLDNFVNEIISTLSISIDVDGDNISQQEDSFVPFIPEVPSIMQEELESYEESAPEQVVQEPEVPTFDTIEEYDVSSTDNVDIAEEVLETQSYNEPEVIEESNIINTMEPMSIPSIEPITPIEVVEPKRKYDVEEILKIAKSPVASFQEEVKSQDETDYNKVQQLNNSIEKEVINTEFDEKEIVEEMINRLSRRLELINERQSKYDDEKTKVEDDEVFVNDLIESSNNKKQELDKFEEELNKKEQELKEKQIELERKLNDVLPFANAIMKEEN